MPLRKWGTRCLTSAGALWLLLVFTPAVNWWAQWLSVGYSEKSLPVLIVLGGDRLSEEALGYSSYLRSVYAARLWKQNHPEITIISGGPASSPLSALMADLMASFGVPRDSLRLERSAETTRENLAAVAQILQGKPQPALLLTSDFHMRRAMLLARKNGLNVEPHPVPDVLKRSLSNRWERPALMLLLGAETAKLAWESLRN